MEQQEIWKDIEGYEGLYQVSNLGQVRSMPRNIDHGKYVAFQEGRILSQIVSPCGYCQVNLSKDGIARPILVHRLVAIAFIDGYKDGLEVNHIDENKLNNRVGNLEWVTSKDNCNYGTRNERVKSKVSRAVEQRDMDGKLLKVYPSVKEAKRATGINDSNICACCKGKKKSADGFKWNYVQEKEKKNVSVTKQKAVRDDIDGEIWRDVEGFDGRYQVSNMGRVWIVNTCQFRKTRRAYGKSVIVTLYKGSVPYNVTLAKLVAKHFIPKYQDGNIVLHLNNNSDDCRACNLELSTRERRMSNLQSVSAQNRKKPVLQYSLSGELLAEYPSVKSAATAIGRSEISIASAARGEQNTAYGYVWRYKNP